jgi:uncharacterized membrane protein
LTYKTGSDPGQTWDADRRKGEELMAATTKGTYRLPATIRVIEDVDRSGHWLSAGWRDFLKTPVISLVYGSAFVVLGYLLTYGLYAGGQSALMLPLGGGFIILAPILVVGLYDVSRRLEAGEAVSLRHVFGAFGDSAGQLSAMGVALLVCFLVWVEVALFLFMLFFSTTPPPLEQFFQDVVFSLNGAPLLIVGSIVGAIFGAVVFSISAVSVPLIYDRPIDVISAIIVSLAAVRLNFRVMFGWAALIVIVIASGLVTALLGLAIALPVLAYATWHCYRDVLDPAEPTMQAPAAEAPAI